MFPEVSFDGSHVLFSYCKVDSDPPRRGQFLDRHFHLYEVDATGSHLRQLTDGPYDDFSPRYLPDGKIIFVSTRRGGYHRCGAGPLSGVHPGVVRGRRLEPAGDLLP